MEILPSAKSVSVQYESIFRSNEKVDPFGVKFDPFWGVKFYPFFLQIIVANCWTESPLIKMFLPTSSPTTRTPSVKDFFSQNFFRLKLFLFCQNWCSKLWHCGKSLHTRQFDYRLIKCIFLVQFLSLEFIKFTSRTALFSSQIVLDINNFNV